MLSVRDLHAAYATAAVLHGIDLEVGPGEVVALLGRNGMGKTTLLRAIAGVRPPACGPGSVRLRGDELLELPTWEVARRGVGVVPQGRRVFGSLSVEENLRVVARSGHGHGWSPERVYDLFPQLAERRRQKAATLSGPIARIFSSSQRAATRPNSSRLMPWPCSTQYGWSMCSMPGIGKPPCACMPAMPPSDAPAIVEP